MLFSLRMQFFKGIPSTIALRDGGRKDRILLTVGGDEINRHLDRLGRIRHQRNRSPRGRDRNREWPEEAMAEVVYESPGFSAPIIYDD